MCRIINLISSIIMKNLHAIAFILVIIGGLNWLLVGLIGWDIGSLLGGQGALFSKVIYILVGLSALYLVFTNKSSDVLSKPAEPMSAPNTPPNTPM